MANSRYNNKRYSNKRRRGFLISQSNLALMVLAGVLLIALVVILVRIFQRDQTQPLAVATLPAVTTQLPTAPPAPAATEQSAADWTGAVVVATPNMPVFTPPPVVTPAPTVVSNTVQFGDQGDKVRDIQRRLKELKYLSGSADGDFGIATETAVKAFQKANGLYADGVVGEKTLTKLNSSSAKANTSSSSGGNENLEVKAKATSVPPKREYTPSQPDKYRYLQVGSSGSDVTKLQKRLIELGYLGGSASGKYDEETQQAIIAFQDRNGEWVDGVAGEDTQTKLFSSNALPAQGGRD